LYVCIEQGGLLRSIDSGRTWHEIDSWFLPQDTFYRDSHRLVLAPRDVRVMYIATGDGVCKSTDAGTTWTRLTTGGDRVGYQDIVLRDPGDDDVVRWPVLVVIRVPGTSRRRGRVWCTRRRRAELAGAWRRSAIALRGNIEAMSMVSWPGGLAFYFGTAVGEVWSTEGRGAHWH
jgi:hypothetical protein